MGLNVVPICDSPAGCLVRLLMGFQWDRYGHICTLAQMHTIWFPLFVHYMGPSTIHLNVVLGLTACIF